MTADDIRNATSFAKAKEIIRNKITQTDDSGCEWLVRGLMAIFARQTSTEQQTEQTHDHNDIGFNSADAEILTSFAKQWQQKNWLSDKQMAILRRKMQKYAGQLAKIVRAMPAPVATS